MGGWGGGGGGGATRSTQLTYSQIKSVCGTICMRRSCKQGSKSAYGGEEGSRIQFRVLRILDQEGSRR